MHAYLYLYLSIYIYIYIHVYIHTYLLMQRSFAHPLLAPRPQSVTPPPSHRGAPRSPASSPPPLNSLHLNSSNYGLNSLDLNSSNSLKWLKGHGAERQGRDVEQYGGPACVCVCVCTPRRRLAPPQGVYSLSFLFLKGVHFFLSFFFGTCV